MTKQKPVRILLVEDNVVDVEAIKRSFERERLLNPIHVAGDGVEALAKLRSDPQLAPVMVLLDLNLPRMTGLEFLTELRDDPELKKTIVFVLTTSSAEEDRLASYELNVAGYVVKSEVGRNFIELVQMLKHYWRVVEFPPESRTIVAGEAAS